MAKPAIFICQLPMEEEKKREKEVSCGKREGQRGREGWSRKPGRNGGLGGGKPSWGSVQA